MPAEPLLRALSRMRSLLLDDQALVRAVASGRRRGEEPRWRRVELRYVDLKAGRHLQVTAYDATQAHTSNHAVGDAARDAVDDLLDLPFANWHVETTTEQHQVRVTKKLEAMVHTSARAEEVEVERGHDRAKSRLLPEDDPVLVALGISDKQGRIKPSRQAKYRQVEEFLRLLDASVTDALDAGALRRPTPDEPLRIVDLGCGNAYLSFAAHRFLFRGGPAALLLHRRVLPLLGRFLAVLLPFVDVRVFAAARRGVAVGGSVLVPGHARTPEYSGARRGPRGSGGDGCQRPACCLRQRSGAPSQGTTLRGTA